jgi:peptidyl-prolyl cis-trans isomerase B (cyclophilin B)
MECADKIVNVPRTPGDRPLQDQRMKTVTVETFGQEYPQPEKL